MLIRNQASRAIEGYNIITINFIFLDVYHCATEVHFSQYHFIQGTIGVRIKERGRSVLLLFKDKIRTQRRSFKREKGLKSFSVIGKFISYTRWNLSEITLYLRQDGSTWRLFMYNQCSIYCVCCAYVYLCIQMLCTHIFCADGRVDLRLDLLLLDLVSFRCIISNLMSNIT